MRDYSTNERFTRYFYLGDLVAYDHHLPVCTEGREWGIVILYGCGSSTVYWCSGKTERVSTECLRLA